MDFESQYKSLNNKQRQAVDKTEGPLLVIAGPGTGKTQLLAMRVGKILKETDTGPEAILCITFTDAAAVEMRSRLLRLLGPIGNKVSVFTFHSFGTHIINHYPEYFSKHNTRELVQLDDTSRYRLVESILEKLPLRHPFASQDAEGNFVSVRAVQSAISAFKQAAVSTSIARQLLAENESEIALIEPILQEVFDVARLSAKNVTPFETAANELLSLAKHSQHHNYPPLATVLGRSLLSAYQDVVATGKTGALGTWRDTYMRRYNGQRRLKAAIKQQDFASLIEVYEQYQKLTAAKGVFDYDDMILWVNDALQNNEDLRLTLAENYLYLMVDEYQDTNGAQNQLLRHLTGIDEGNEQPNIMTVGDDDQAIMRFQGAETSHMLAFISDYHLTSQHIITLTDNYRSTAEIIAAARAVITQVPDRLETSAATLGINKNPVARSAHKKSELSHHRFETKAQEFTWISHQIADLLESGVPADEIAVIAPKHRTLIEIANFLQKHHIPITYDRRENILEKPLMKQLVKLCRFVDAYGAGDLRHAEGMLPEILSYEFWGLSHEDRLTVAVHAHQKGISWLEAALDRNNKASEVARLLTSISSFGPHEPAPIIIDMLLGLRPVPDFDALSPFNDYYFGDSQSENTIVETLTQLTTLHRSLESYFGSKNYSLSNFLEWTDLLSRAGISLLNTTVITPSHKSVHVMSAHGSKGREFAHVYLAGATQDLWGKGRNGSLGQAYLPENLPIYPTGNAPEDRTRLFFVALTRAKHHAHITGHTKLDNGKTAETYEVIEIASQLSSDWPTAIDMSFDDLTGVSVAQLAETQWQAAYDSPSATLQDFISSQLSSYSLSPTHMRDFLDVTRGGPAHFKRVHLLHIPEGRNFHASFGSAVHRTLETARRHYTATQDFLSTEKIKNILKEQLQKEQFTRDDLTKATLHAEKIVIPFYESEKESFSRTDKVEVKVTATDQQEHRLNGKIDVLLTDATHREMTIVDYKTGKPPHTSWNQAGLSPHKKISLHFNKLQLCFYRHLLSLSPLTSRTPLHIKAELRYVEPDSETGQLVTLSSDSEDDEEMKRLQLLIHAIWSHIMKAEFPDVSHYSADIKGILAFEDDLIDGKV